MMIIPELTTAASQYRQNQFVTWDFIITNKKIYPPFMQIHVK